MGIIYIIAIPLLSFLTLIFIVNAILKTTSSIFRKITLRSRLMLLIGLSHFLLVSIPCTILAIKNSADPEAVMAFSFYSVIDFIFWPFYIWFLNILNQILSWKSSNIVAPFIAFGILGSLFYCCLGWFLGVLIERNKNKE